MITVTDADATLEATLGAVLNWESAEGGSREELEAAEAATRGIAELDAHLRQGGALPLAWLAAGNPLNLAVVREALERTVAVSDYPGNEGVAQCFRDELHKLNGYGS
jgi:hypothetical protein